MAAPDKSRELALVEKVDFQIALAKSDSKLEALLGKYLAPLLLKLASPHVEVRNQVLKTCEHVNVRVKGAALADLKLPVAALLQQFRDVDNGLVRHVDLQFIKLGIDRVPVTERLLLLPVILKGVADVYRRSAQQSSTLFSLFVRLLPHVQLPPRGSADDTNLRTNYELSSDDAEFLASWLGKLLLYQGPQEHAPGLSKSDMEFFTFNEQSFWTVPGKLQGSINIGEAKLLATKFLVSGVFQEGERLIPAIIASADPNSRISDSGQDMLKRAIPATDLDDTALIDRLYTLYTGSPPDIPAVRFPLKQRLLGILSKSVEATKHKDAQMVIKDAISPQSYGLEENKLKTEAFAFVIWITRVGGEYMNAEALIEDIKELINSQGWPKPETSGNAQTDKALLDARARAYETIGLLMKSDAKLASSTNSSLHPAQLVQWLFTSLAEDSSGQTVSLSIESAISNAIVALSATKSNPEEEAAIFSALDDCLRSSAADTLQARTVYPALRFANKCFPFANRQARMLNLLALSRSNPRHEIVEEAKNGLDPYLQSLVYHSELSESSGTSASLPDFPRLVKTFFNDKNKLGTGALSSQACSEGVKLAKNILFHEALQARYKPPVIDQHWNQNIEAASANDEDAIKAIKSEIFEHYSDRIDEDNPLEALMQEALDTLIGPAYSTASAEPLLALLSFSPRQAMSGVIRRANQIQDRVVSNDAFVRGIAAHIYGILRSLGSITGKVDRETRKDIDLLVGSFKTSYKSVGAEINRAAGNLLALSHWLARLHFLGDGKIKQDISDDIKWLSTSYLELLEGKTDKVLSEAASAGLVQLALFESPAEFILPIIDDDNSKALDNLKKVALTGNESAVNALGYISLALEKDLEEEPRLQKLIDIAYDLHETRQAEVQFAVGSVFSLLAFGRESKALIGKIDVDGPDLMPRPRQQAAASIIEKVLKACKNTKPSLRQASAIWLLCLVRDGGHMQTIKDNLPACQLAFKALLGDKDSLNQETGSMGLGIVYEQGGKDLKGELIKDLIGTFTETKSSLSGNVSDDTQLFEPGALPTENGQSVTTYKDIINLANEVGDPGLVYRFMSLAANSSIWSSRAAFGRFGLSRVLSDASVDGYLSTNPKLYSSLYRYRFDPNPNVQRAMNDIWTALVKDPSKTVDEHFDHIIQDLLKTIVGKEWRTRQASCAALGDLLQGRQLQKYEKYLNEIWAQTFKVCDDIKGSVRKAAMALARVLTGIVTRTLEAGEASAKTANSMLKQVVPFLLGPSGIEATAKESQAFALLTLLDIIKKGAATVLRPYIPELVGRLLPLLSSLEPEAANYLHLNADKYKITTQDLDDMRTNAVKASPMMEAIERCLDKLDEDSMKALMPSLAEAAKTVIGLPSRVGVARVLISLATRRNFLFKPHVSQFLVILRNKHVTDRNDTVATSAAVACGYLARLAEDKDILKLVEWSQKKYFGEEDERYRVIAGELVHALAKYATDRFASLSSSILPFVYLAKHDTHEAAAQVFKDAWEESVAGNRAVLLYLKEIISLCSEHLDSPRWAIKHASALTVADAVHAAGSDIAEADAKTIWPALEKALAAKTWSGKEKVLESFVILAKKSNLISQDAKLATQMRKIAIREAKRNNEAYKPHALEALSDFISVAKETDWFETVPAIVDETLEQLDEASGGDAMDVDSKSGGSSSKITAQKTRASAVKVLFTSLDPKHREGPGLKDDLGQCLKVAKKALEERDREINETVLESSKQLFERLSSQNASQDPVEAVLAGFVDVVTQFADAPEQTRLKAVEAAESLAKLGVKGIDAKLAQKAGELKTLERNEGIKRKWTALEE